MFESFLGEVFGLFGACICSELVEGFHITLFTFYESLNYVVENTFLLLFSDCYELFINGYCKLFDSEFSIGGLFGICIGFGYSMG